MSLESQLSELQKDNGQLRERIAKLERTVAFLLTHTNATYVDQPDTDPFADVAALIHSGNRLEAVKLYRAKTGASLAQAQEFISQL